MNLCKSRQCWHEKKWFTPLNWVIANDFPGLCVRHWVGQPKWIQFQMDTIVGEPTADELKPAN